MSLRLFYCMGSSMKSIPNIFSYVYQQFFRMPYLLFGDKMLRKTTTKIKCQLLQVFLIMHDYLNVQSVFLIS